MFTYLIETVFPLAGDFFGRLSALAVAPSSQFYAWFSALWDNQGAILSISYTNLYTGVVSVMRLSVADWSVSILEQAYTKALSLVGRPLFPNVPTPAFLSLAFTGVVFGSLWSFVKR